LELLFAKLFSKRKLMHKKSPTVTHIATYGIELSLAGGGEITDFSTKKINAETDEKAIEVAEGYRKVLEELELLEPCAPDMAKRVLLVSVRSQKNKRLVHFIGRLE
jgi:hypothetical protein